MCSGAVLYIQREQEKTYLSLRSVKMKNMFREEFKNKEGNMTRFTDIPSVLMVNTNLLGGMKIQGYEDLLDERLKGKIAMCDRPLLHLPVSI